MNNSGTWGCEVWSAEAAFDGDLVFDLEDFDWNGLCEFDGTEGFGAEKACESEAVPVFFSIFDKRLSKSAFAETDGELVDFVETFDDAVGPKLKDNADPVEEEPKSHESPVEIAGFAAGFTSSSFTSSS